MAVKSLYFKNTAPTGAAAALSLQDGGTAPATGITTTGWTVAKLATPNFSILLVGTKVASGTFATTDRLTGAFTQSSCFRTENALVGTFANTNWSLAFRLRAVSSSSSQTGKVAIRIWRSANADGTGATQITSATQTGTTTAVLSTTASGASTVTWSPGATFQLLNEYLWVQCEWSITATAGANAADAVFYIESTGVITTSDFVASIAGTGALSNASNPSTLASTGVGSSRGTSGALTSAISTLAGSGTVITLAQPQAAISWVAVSAVEVPSITGLGSLVAGNIRTNVALRSQELDAATWTKSAVTVTPNATTAIDGTITAELLADNTTNTTHGISQVAIPTPIGVPHTVSFYAKRNSHSWVQLSAGADAGSLRSLGPSLQLTETEVFSTTLTTNDGGWAGYTVRNVVPVTGMSDTTFLVAIFDFDDVVSSGNRYIQGLPTIDGTPSYGSYAGFQGGFFTYDRTYQTSSGLPGFIYGVNSIKVRGTGANREICARFEASTVIRSKFKNASIGIWDGTNTTSSGHQGATRWTPVELKWGGASGVDIAAGTMSAYSDWMPFPDNVVGAYGGYNLNSNNGGWSNNTLVNVLNFADLRPSTGTRVRVGINISADAGAVTTVYIGQQSTTGDPFDFKATAKRLTYGGSNSITHDGVKSFYLSDIVDLPEPWDNSKNYLVVGEFTGTNIAVRYSTVYVLSGTSYYKGATEAALVDKTGYAQFFMTNATMVEVLEVWPSLITDAQANFDLSIGVVGQASGYATSTSIYPVGNDWYRCSMSFVPDNATSVIKILHRDGNTLTPQDYAGTGTSYWAWGVQVERSGVATEYITTTSAPVTAGITSIVSGSGTASTTVADAGTLQSQNSALVASGLSKSTGTGVLTSANCTGAGLGVSRSVSTSAALVASNSTIVSSGISQSVSTFAALAASVSTLSGAGISRSVSTLAVLNAPSSILLGSGISASFGTGILIDAGSALVGNGTAAFPAATGTGVLVAASAVLIGIDINTEYLYPDADAAIGGWTDQVGGTTNLYQAVDEATANDTDYVQSSFNPTNDIIRFRMSDPTAGVGIPFDVSYRYGISGVGPSCTITARLKQGNTVIKSWAHTDGALALKTVSQSLSAGELATITNFSDLFVEFEAGP